ncbi:MAG: methyltransferase domain-containing protein, partial [Proteobacteria bacterium]|nr:methyltransferase domain-containing protein [Pseudomonadota bacterium]
ERIRVMEGNALGLPFADGTFDAALCLEVAGDICVTAAQKRRLAKEAHRVLRPGARLGFSDLVFTGRPSREEERAMRTILYHDGEELMTDWPGIFRANGFRIDRCEDIMEHTMKTWEHSLAVYEGRAAEVERRYGRSVARRTMNHLRMIPDILRKYGSFVVMSAERCA